MKIGILMPGGYSLVSKADGRKNQILYQAEGLERLGHTIVRLNPWEKPDISDLDALHIVEGAVGNYVAMEGRITGPKVLSVAPFIDSNQPNWSYRFLAWLGTRRGVIMTPPGLFQRQMKSCDLVVARSMHEKQRIIYGIGIEGKETLVDIVLNGVNPPPPADPELARHRLNLPKEYLLHVGTYTQGRKNVERLIEATAPTGLPLVIAGDPEGEVAARVMGAARRNKHVHMFGFQEPEVLASLYAGCRVFCLPSVHEGTGLVALEAAAYGKGVVITNCGGPPDYFKDLAYYVDYKSLDSIRQAVLEAWENPRGEELRRHVLTNLTWDKSAESLARSWERARKHRK